MSDWHAFITAVENDDVVTVKRMRADFIDARLGFALWQASKNNSVGVVAELLKEPSDDILVYTSEALMDAARFNSVEALRIILPHTDPKLHDSNALLWAVAHNHQACVDVLFDLSDVDRVGEIVNERRELLSAEGVAYFEQRVNDRAQHATLTEEVSPAGVAGARKKI